MLKTSVPNIFAVWLFGFYNLSGRVAFIDPEKYKIDFIGNKSIVTRDRDRDSPI